jgi:hypothetical protein
LYTEDLLAGSSGGSWALSLSTLLHDCRRLRKQTDSMTRDGPPVRIFAELDLRCKREVGYVHEMGAQTR